MPALELVTPHNALVFKEARLWALQDTPSAFGSTYAKEAQYADADWIERAQQWTGEKSATYLAMDGGAPCGIVSGFLDRDDPAVAHLVAMWVAPTHRRRGVDRQLVEAVVAWSQSRHARELRLHVMSDNEAATALYKRLGFSMTGRTEPQPDRPELERREMTRPLAGDTAP